MPLARAAAAKSTRSAAGGKTSFFVSKDILFDRFYAARQTRIILAPSHTLETFDNTLVNYHLISELEDYPGKIRVREGRLEAHKPLVLTPSNFAEIEMQGFGEEAREFLDFLKEHDDDMRILQYGYHLKSDKFSEQIITDSISLVTDRVIKSVKESNDKFSAVLQGVDSPWDVALIVLWRHEIQRSAGKNIKELADSGGLFSRG
jgi:hypothetical protein